MTIGAPNTAVTVLILNSVGEKTVLAIQSQSRQNAPPPKKQAGINQSGFAVRSRFFIRCGTAIPTKEIGPANAVTHAESRLDNKINATRNKRIGTPRFCA